MLVFPMHSQETIVQRWRALPSLLSMTILVSLLTAQVVVAPEFPRLGARLGRTAQILLCRT